MPQPQAMPPAAMEDQDQPVPDAQDAGSPEPDEQQHPPTMAQPGIQPMPVKPGQNEPQQPAGPVGVPGKGAVIAPTPGQLPVPPQKPEEKPDDR